MTVKTLDYPFPREYVKTAAVARGISAAELETLELALDGHSTIQISHQLKLSAIAVRKRLGEVYRKFNIPGSGPGKLATLKHQLTLEFQATAQTTPLIESDRTPSQIDWGEAPHITELFGRNQELDQLQQLIVGDRTRLVTILGMGKIGKTALAVKLVQQIYFDFDIVIWRSLRSAPPLDELLADLIQTLSGYQPLSPSPFRQIFQLIECFRNTRCLVVLDDMETLFEKGKLAGNYREGYHVYDELLRQVSELFHHSCLMILSQEEPPEIAVQAGITQPVRVLRLQGLSEMGSEALLHRVLPEIITRRNQISKLVRHCDGHPLLLRLVAQKVQELFNGDLEQFYQYYEVLFGRFDPSAWIGEFLDSVFRHQFERVSNDEYQILNLLALLSQNPAREYEIKFISCHPKRLNIWRSLERRSLLYKTSESGEFNSIINPLIRQYINQYTKEKIYQIIEEKQNQTLEKSEILELFGISEKEDNPQLELQNKIGLFFSQLGYHHYMNGDFSSAKVFLNWAIEFDPNLAEAHFNLGSTYDKLEDLDAAQSHYQKAIESSASSEKYRYLAQNNLARLEIKKGKPQTAIELIEPILSEVVDSTLLATMYKNLGWAYFQKNLYSQSEHFLLTALQYDKTIVPVYYLLAKVKTAQGNNQEALEYWQEGLNRPLGKAGLSKAWKWPEIEIWESEAPRQLQKRA